MSISVRIRSVATSAVDSLAGIIFGGIALTDAALHRASGGQELTFGQWRRLLYIGETDEGARVSDVARRFSSTLPATSRSLRRLERRGLLTLTRDEQDRRVTRARLTSEGKALRSAVLAHRRRAISRIVRAVRPPAEAERVLEELATQFVDAATDR